MPARTLGRVPCYTPGVSRGPFLTSSTLEAMCRVLDCQPGDLLEWVEE
ncbi:helix-turn-helix domain-containing protein [Micromonospora craniellae]|nr:helix-turn-helix domain-containing protein [Micromonospora craniellae]